MSRRRKVTAPPTTVPYYTLGQVLIARQPCLCGSNWRLVKEDIGYGFVRVACMECDQTWTSPGTTDPARAQTSLMGAA